MSITVTDDDIAFAEQLTGKHFDNERRIVLKCMDRRDIQACPGSGKTTTLTAKLAILLRKLPNDEDGICVLSHTNVAREEIERALGKYTHRLLRHPHFVGTIQSFVDRFLAGPAMLVKYGIRPTKIDDDTFSKIAASRFSQLPDVAEKFSAHERR